MLSDTSGGVIDALGLTGEMGQGLGKRSKRFALIMEDKVVKCVAGPHQASSNPFKCTLATGTPVLRAVVEPSILTEPLICRCAADTWRWTMA